MTKTPICSQRLNFDGESYLGQIIINVDKIGERYRISTPAIPGQDENGIVNWASTLEQARSVYRAMRRQFPRYIPA